MIEIDDDSGATLWFQAESELPQASYSGLTEGIFGLR